MIDLIFDIGKIVIADIVLSGDNALIIAMAASGLPPELRKRAIIIGMVMAAVLRIIFAVIATKLLGVPGLLFIGGLLLFWVCWELFKEIKKGKQRHEQEQGGEATSGEGGVAYNSMGRALWAILVADVSMSLDNVLAVAAIAHGNLQLLIFGLALAIALMVFAATIIMKILTKYPWISWAGLAVLLYVSGEMLWRGIFDEGHGILYIMGWGI